MRAIASIGYLGPVLLFTGCVTLYKPNTVYSPMLMEKGETNTSASIGLSGNGLYNVQAAHAVSNHVGIMLDGMYHHRQSGSDNSSVEKLNIFSGEMGVGYFTMFDTDTKLFQCYGGLGYGSSKDKIENQDQVNPDVSARYVNVFVQPGVALLTKDNLELSLDIRANYIHLYNINAYLYEQFEWWNTDFEYYSDTTINFGNVEPAVTLRLGGQNLKGVFQLGAIIPTIHSKSYFYVNTSSMLGVSLLKISLGVSYTFKPKKQHPLAIKF